MTAPQKVVKPVPKLAWIVAAAADLVQLVAFPFFGQGAFSPVNDALDVVVSIVLVRLLGWHLVLLPALAAELVPLVDLAPTWTLSVGVVAMSRGRGAGAAPPVAPATPGSPGPQAPSGSHAEVVEGPPTTLPGPPDPPRV